MFGPRFLSLLCPIFNDINWNSFYWLSGALAASDGTITLQSIFIYTKYFLCRPLSIISSDPMTDIILEQSHRWKTPELLIMLISDNECQVESEVMWPSPRQCPHPLTTLPSPVAIMSGNTVPNPSRQSVWSVHYSNCLQIVKTPPPPPVLGAENTWAGSEYPDLGIISARITRTNN